MPKTNMYVYDDVVDSRIRRFIASKLMNESEFLKKNHLSAGTLGQCRRSHRISRPLIVFFISEGADFSGINFELDE